MKTLTIAVPKSMRQGQAHYLVPAKAGTGPVPSLRLAVGKENRVEVADAAHEALLRADRNIKVLDEEGQHDRPEVDELDEAIKKLPPDVKAQLERGLRQAERDMRDELEAELDKQGSAIAETRKQLDGAIAKQDAVVKENAELQAKVKELEAKLAEATKPPAVPPVDEKAKDTKAEKPKK